MAALGLNMKGKAEKKKPAAAKAKKKPASKVKTKPATAKKLQLKKVEAKVPDAKGSQTKKVKAKASVTEVLHAKKVPAKAAAAKPKQEKVVAKVTEKVKTDKKTEKKTSPQKEKPATSKENTKTAPVYKLRNASFLVEPSKRRKIRKTKVIMEGDLNINNVDAFIQQIKPLFDEYDFIDFFLREANSLDLSYLQMLYYFQNNFVKKGKTVTVDADLTPEFRKIIINNGFKEFMFIPKLV